MEIHAEKKVKKHSDRQMINPGPAAGNETINQAFTVI